MQVIEGNALITLVDRCRRGHLLKDVGVEGKRLRWQAIQHAMLNSWAYRTSENDQKQQTHWEHLGVSANSGTPKWMVYNGKPYWNGWFGGTIIFGNTHFKFNNKTCSFDSSVSSLKLHAQSCEKQFLNSRSNWQVTSPDQRGCFEIHAAKTKQVVVSYKWLLPWQVQVSCCNFLNAAPTTEKNVSLQQSNPLKFLKKKDFPVWQSDFPIYDGPIGVEDLLEDPISQQNELMETPLLHTWTTLSNFQFFHSPKGKPKKLSYPMSKCGGFGAPNQLPRNGRCPNSHNRFAQEDVNHRWQSSIQCCCCLSPRYTWLIFEGGLRMISDVSNGICLKSILCAQSIYYYVATYCTLPKFNYLSIKVATYTPQTQLTSILICWPSKLGVKSFQLRAMWATTYLYLRKCFQHGLQN